MKRLYDKFRWNDRERRLVRVNHGEHPVVNALEDGADLHHHPYSNGIALSILLEVTTDEQAREHYPAFRKQVIEPCMTAGKIELTAQGIDLWLAKRREALRGKPKPVTVIPPSGGAAA